MLLPRRPNTPLAAATPLLGDTADRLRLRGLLDEPLDLSNVTRLGTDQPAFQDAAIDVPDQLAGLSLAAPPPVTAASVQSSPSFLQRFLGAFGPENGPSFAEQNARLEAQRLANESNRQRLQSGNAVREFLASANLTPDQRAFLDVAAQADPGAALAAAGDLFGVGSATPTRGLEARFEAIEKRLGRALSQDEILQLAGAAPQANENLNLPIPIPQLNSVRLPDGSPVPLGTTFAEARAAGAQISNQTERDRLQQADAALSVINQLEELAIGEDGVLSNVDTGFLNRAVAGLGFGLEILEQNDPRASLFRDLSQGTIGPLIRSLGEKGALSDGDVNRALSLLPSIFPLPDSGPVATQKLKDLRGLISKGVSNLNERSVLPSNNSPSPVESIPGFDALSPEEQAELRQRIRRSTNGF